MNVMRKIGGGVKMYDRYFLTPTESVFSLTPESNSISYVCQLKKSELLRKQSTKLEFKSYDVHLMESKSSERNGYIEPKEFKIVFFIYMKFNDFERLVNLNMMKKLPNQIIIYCEKKDKKTIVSHYHFLMTS
jgi:hypothetical protein